MKKLVAFVKFVSENSCTLYKNLIGKLLKEKSRTEECGFKGCHQKITV